MPLLWHFHGANACAKTLRKIKRKNKSVLVVRRTVNVFQTSTFLGLVVMCESERVGVPHMYNVQTVHNMTSSVGLILLE